ncbi:hypothetical protein PPO43_05755 [Saprospira sp. CCB-QB6]|uniref:hypothetical protein n=1 Tax=Saprospira sp. CCB-QB6 TaxID=3023936 RepID=UPI00234A76BA|nr:hypothetical protein [Saprospira sp. CCB-QB6]WCL82602.1 hypothetical protein PPO43_05755 [Saprospira sp. CCB-QB6]
MKKSIKTFAIVLGLVFGVFVVREAIIVSRLKTTPPKVETNAHEQSLEMAKKWLDDKESLAESLRKTIMEMDLVFKYVKRAKEGTVKDFSLLFELQRKIDDRMPLIIQLPLVQNNKSMLETLEETEEAYGQWEVDYKDPKYFRIMTYTNSVRRAQISNLVGTIEREEQQSSVKK